MPLSLFGLVLKISYADLGRHKKIHLYLLRKIVRLRNEYRDEKLKPSAFFSLILDDLIVGHLVKEDRLFFPYLERLKYKIK